MPPALVRLAGMSEPVLVSMLLGYPRSDLRRRLVDAVLRGEKTATSSLLSDYGPDESLPQLGEREILRGFDDDDALAIVETTDVRVMPILEVDLAFAVAEGEGFTTVAKWRAAHEEFWGREVSNEELVVAQRFRLVKPLP